MTVDASKYSFEELNEQVRNTSGNLKIINCLGERFIGTGLKDRTLDITGIPGNALGAYLNGGVIRVSGNAQDAVGDTMNEGRIVVHGNIGDATGYAMRGGEIFVEGNAGYRAGIHMKEYKEKFPVIVIGGKAGSFLGEYQAGGIIIVLGLNDSDAPIVGDFPCTGMHGGKLFLRSDCKGIEFPSQVNARKATKEELKLIDKYITEYCKEFGLKKSEILSEEFTIVTPDSKNPYKQMYVAN